MARQSFIVRRNADGTATFRVRRENRSDYIEHFDPRIQGPVQTWEQLKWAAVTAGFGLSDDMLEQLMREVRGLTE
jgi:hypothetical protein